MDYISEASAAGYYIQMLEPEAFISALDGSGDLPDGKGMEAFDDLLTSKYMDLDPLLVADLEIMGIEQPIWVEVDGDEWFMADGHHRLAWAAQAGVEVPILFVDEATDVYTLVDILGDDRYYDHAA